MPICEQRTTLLQKQAPILPKQAAWFMRLLERAGAVPMATLRALSLQQLAASPCQPCHCLLGQLGLPKLCPSMLLRQEMLHQLLEVHQRVVRRVERVEVVSVGAAATAARHLRRQKIVRDAAAVARSGKSQTALALPCLALPCLASAPELRPLRRLLVRQKNNEGDTPQV